MQFVFLFIMFDQVKKR